MSYTKCFAHYKSIQRPEVIGEAVKDHVFSSDFHAISKFQRIDVKHVVMPPQTRLGLPRAESMREEFVFVISGKPDLWVSGWIYPLDPLDSVGFQPGTGHAHTVLNNSDQEVQLLLIRERAKSGNKSFFPLNKNCKDEMGPFWWGSAPELDIGPHDAEPHNVRSIEISRDKPQFIARGKNLEIKGGFHYPGDMETFFEGARLSTLLGLKTLGIWLNEAPPGKRSCYPHAHTHEEELSFVVSGHPSVWLNGFKYELEPGNAVAFQPNTNVSHCLINDTDKKAVEICVGEATEFPSEKVNYPMHPFRNSEGIIGGWAWQSPPPVEMGPHNGRPKNAAMDILSLRSAKLKDAKEVLAIFEKSPKYFEAVDGAAPTLATVEYYIKNEPTVVGAKYRKDFLLIQQDGIAIGAAELHHAHPEEGISYIALLLLTESHLGRYLGKRSYELIEDYCRRAQSTKKIRLGISAENDVTGFWRKMGFEPSGHTYAYKGEHITTQVVEFEKILIT